MLLQRWGLLCKESAVLNPTLNRFSPQRIYSFKLISLQRLRYNFEPFFYAKIYSFEPFSCKSSAVYNRAMRRMFKKLQLANFLHFNPLSPHDALKHHFTTLKTDFIFLQLTVLEGKFPWNSFTNTRQFSLIFYPLQVIFSHYKQFSACSGWRWQW